MTTRWSSASSIDQPRCWEPGTTCRRRCRPENGAVKPGTRAPHLWVSRDGVQRSTLDLLQRDWMLVTEDDRWCAAAAHAGRDTGIDLQCLYFGSASGIGGTTISPPTAGTSALTLDTPIEHIVAVPEGKGVLDANIPAVTTHDGTPRSSR